MKVLKTIDEALQYIEEKKIERKKKLEDINIFVCIGTGCAAKGSIKIYDAFKDLFKETKRAKAYPLEENNNRIKKTGCCGRCSSGPWVIVMPYGYFYCEVKLEDVKEIYEETILKGKAVERLLFVDPATSQRVEKLEDAKFFKAQSFYIMEDIGKCECNSIDDYMGRGGYLSFLKVLVENKPDKVIQIIKDSGLRGRGGAGFPTGIKWEITKNSKGDRKFVVCNGDEGDPGAFMNRTLLERDPHAVLEGMLIGAYTIGANKGYAYIRAEYPVAVEMFRKAIEDAKNLGLIGENILGTSFSFDIEIKEGAGAFVCGEETALLASIEGKRGIPRPRPPYPAQAGLWGCPTLINNVETYANIPKIIRDGAEAYRKRGVPNSPGTKMFSVTGPVKLTGIIEVEFGTTLREIIYDICGGLSDGDELKAVQIGGPSGACLSEALLDLPLDYDSLKTAGAMVGSGGIVVLSKKTCMVEVARFFLDFTKRESCGKCIPCREGLMQAYHILEKFTQAKGSWEDLENLEFLADLIKKASACGLGQTAPNPILSTLRFFKDEYIAHIDGICPSGMCTAFKKYFINPDLCKGCGLCARSCPKGAILGERGRPYRIEQEECIKCGACFDKCKFKAIEIR